MIEWRQEGLRISPSLVHQIVHVLLNLTSEDLDKLTPSEINNLYYNRKERTQFNEQGQKIDVIRPNIAQLYQTIQEEKRSVRNSIRNKLQLPESEIIKRDYINHPKNLASWEKPVGP